MVIRPTIDDKEIKQDMREIAETSKTAMEQTYRSLETVMRKSLEAWGEGVKVGKNIDMDEFVGDFREKMKELNNEIVETGNLPLGMTSKLLDAEQHVERLIDAYYKLNRQIEEMSPDTKFVETNQYAKLSSELGVLQEHYDTVTHAIKRLEQEQANLEEREKLVASVGGQTVVDNYNKQIEKIETLNAKIRELRDAQGGDPNSGMNVGLTGKALEDNIRQIQDYQRQIENIRTSMRLFGNDTVATLERIRDLESSVSEEHLLGGKESIASEIDYRKQKLNELIAKMGELKQKQQELAQSGGQYTLSSEYNKATEEVRRLEIEIVKAASRVNELTNSASKTTGAISNWRNVIWSASRVLGSVYTISLDIARGAKKIANFYMKIWNYAKRVVSVIKQWRKGVLGTAVDHAKSFATMIKDVLRYSLGIRSLFALFRKLRGAIKEAFEALAEQVPEVNATMSELLSTLNMVKGSLATAFEPIVTAIAPMLDFLMEKLATLLTYIGMFFAALTGRGYVYKANKSMTSFADTTKGAADNAKELNKQLQGFDELNNLTTQKDKKSGGAESPLAEFEKIDIPDWIKDLAEKLKDIFNRIMDPIRRAWEKVGDYVVAAWKRAFNSVKDLLHDILRDFLRAWDELGESIATHFFLILGDIGNIIANIADAIREAWNTNENGYKIWVAILTIVDKVLEGIRRITEDMRDWTATLNLIPLMTAFREWLESVIPLVEALMDILFNIWDRALKPILDWAFNGEDSGLAKFFNILRDFNNKLDLDKIVDDLNKIWDALGRFGQTVGEGLLIFMERMLGYLANWLNSDEFTEWCQTIADFFDNIHPEDIADKLEQVWRILKNIKDALWAAIKLVIDNIDWILDKIEWISANLKWLIPALLGFKLTIDVGRAIANVYLFVKALKVAKGAADALSGAGGKVAQSLFLGADSAWKSLGGLKGLLTTDLETIIGAGTAKEAGLAIGSSIVIGITEFFAVAELSKKLGEWIFPSDADLYEYYKGIDGTLKLIKDSALSLKDVFKDAFEDEASHDYDKYTENVLEKSGIREYRAQVEELVKEYNNGRMTAEAFNQNVVNLIRSSETYGNIATDAMGRVTKTSIEANGIWEEAMENPDKFAQHLIDVANQIPVEYDGMLQDTNNVIKEASDGVQTYSDAFNRAQNDVGTYTDAFNRAQNDIATTNDKATSSAENLSTSIDGAADSAENLADKVQLSADMVDSMLEQLQSQISDADWAEIWSPVKTGFDDFWTTFKDDVNTDVQELMSELPGIIESNLDMPTLLAPIDTGVSEFMNTVKTTVTTKLGEITTAVQDGITNMKVSIDSSLTGINDTFANAFSGISEMSTSLMQDMTRLFSEGMSIIDKAYGDGWTNMLKITQTATQQIMSLLSKLMSMLNQIPRALETTMRQMETVSRRASKLNIGNTINRISGSSSRYRVQPLAEGGVIPPNNEFLALLGDQKHGVNIESPLSTMVEAFNQANKGGSEAEIALLQEQNDLLRQLLNKEFGISEGAIFRSVRNQNDMFTKSTGHSAFA